MGLSDDDPEKGELSLACSGSMAMGLYPYCLDLQVSFPELMVSIEAAPNHKIIEAVQNNSVVLGIITQPLISAGAHS